MRRLVVLGVCLLVALGLAAPSASAAGRVKIERIYYNSPGADYGSNQSLNAEWVKICNHKDHRVRLRGWTLRDAAGHVYRFGRFRLASDSCVKVHTGSGTNTKHHRYWGSGWYIWNNDGDTAKLKRRNGTLADKCSYSDPGENDASVNC